MQPAYPTETDPGLDGPDYVALVIEWNDVEDDSPALVTSPAAAHPIRTIAAVVGALGALLLAAWGIRRLRAA